ncbi:MAG: FAD-binding protein [Burkholderiales bacterium]|nr:FAD-binding protein [Burkholderiales bacterium]
MLPAKICSEFTAILPAERFYTDPVDCYAYSYDNTRKIFPPDAVAFPLDSEEVQRLLGLCNKHSIAVTARGRGTGTAGGSLPEQGGLVLSLERMRKMIAIDAPNRVIVAQPGVLNEEVQRAARPYGLFWPPDPSSAAYSSIGGNLATSAGGPHAIKYGTTRDNVLGMKAVTANGALLETGCYTSKGVVGYDLTRLLIGSEGTLAVIVEATLKLVPLPAAVGGVTAFYRDVTSCAKAVSAIMAQPIWPSALEFLDTGALVLLRGRYPDMLPADARAMLMIEVDGSAHSIAADSEAMIAACGNSGLLHAKAVADAAALWAARKALSPLLRDIAPKKINEDIVVPVSRLADLLEGLAALSERHGVANVNFGHAGNGNIHVNLLVDPHNVEQMRQAEACLDQVFDLVLALNGTLSGEHGVGSEKRAFIAREINPATLSLMKAIKRTFDPNNILNPGKLFPA